LSEFDVSSVLIFFGKEGYKRRVQLGSLEDSRNPPNPEYPDLPTKDLHVFFAAEVDGDVKKVSVVMTGIKPERIPYLLKISAAVLENFTKSEEEIRKAFNEAQLTL